MKDIFKNASEWNESDISTTGLPRPFVSIKDSFRKNLDFFITKKIPIPWQSKPYLQNKAVLNLIKENEDRVFLDSLCGYCGIKIEKNENVIRWHNANFKVRDGKILDPRVLSDILPLHIECMRQARVFCPFMKRLQDNEFIYGTYKELIKDVENIIKIYKIKIAPQN